MNTRVSDLSCAKFNLAAVVVVVVVVAVVVAVHDSHA